MSGMLQAVESASPAPQILFRLPGEWWQISLGESEATESSIHRMVKESVGTADEKATIRERARRELRAAAENAREAEAASMFISTKLNAQTDLPVSLVIYEPSRMRMSPTIGTDPGEVLSTLEQSLALVDPEEVESLTRRTFLGGEVLRTHLVTTEQLDEGASVDRLTVNYWYPVPGSKHIILACFMTPLGSISNVMLSFTDAIVAASWFAFSQAEGEPVVDASEQADDDGVAVAVAL